MSNTGHENLIPLTARTKDEQRDYRQKGGVKSGEIRRAKKTAREAAQLLLAADIPQAKGGDKIRQALDAMGLPENEMNMQMGILAAQATAALKGDSSAARFVFDTAGESAQIQAKEKEIDLKERETELKEALSKNTSSIDPAMVKIWIDGIADTFAPTAPERRLEDFE